MAWDDLRGQIQTGRAAAAPTIEAYRDTSYRMMFFRNNADVDLSFELQLPHRWDPRRNIRPHVHVIPMANGAGTVRLNGHYYWATIGGTVPAVASWTTYNVDTAFVAGDQYDHLVIGLGSFSPPAGASESTILMLFIQREATAVEDTYATNKDHGTPAANLGILGIDAHYEPVKAGTQNELGPV